MDDKGEREREREWYRIERETKNGMGLRKNDI
jgi:hypothetical protein